MEQQTTAEETLRDRYLTFGLAGAAYALPICDVTEIVGVLPATRLPGAPAHIRGLANLRGRILPVLDMRQRLSKPVAADDDKTCTVVVSRGELTAGLVVDRVSDVAFIGNVMPYPEEASYIAGMAEQDGRVIYLLDSGALLNG